MTQSVSAFRAWLDGARPDDRNAADELIPLLSESPFLCDTVVSDSPDNRGHLLIEFWPPPPRGANAITEPRRTKPIYAATIRAFELAGGKVSYAWTNRTESNPSGKFYWRLTIGPLKLIPLQNILFDPGHGEVREREGCYHELVSESFHFAPMLGRGEVLATVRERAGDEWADLIEAMLNRADAWHGPEHDTLKPGPRD